MSRPAAQPSSNRASLARLGPTKYTWLIVFLVVLAGCSGPRQLWNNPGRTQVDFDRDAQECRIIAGELAREATLSGRREDPETFARALERCLSAKGWSPAPAAGAAESTSGTSTAPPAVFSAGSIQAFGRSFPVPPGFVLRADVAEGQGAMVVQQILLSRDDSYINYTVQKSAGRPFVPVDYPVEAPFFLYEQGEAGGKRARLRWAMFAGEIQGIPVAGLGGYLLSGKRERVTIVITSPLPPAAEPTPPGLRLAANQVQAMEQFRQEWLPWLERQP